MKTPENVPASYRLAENIVKQIEDWKESGIIFHATDIYQMIAPFIATLEQRCARLEKALEEVEDELIKSGESHPWIPGGRGFEVLRRVRAVLSETKEGAPAIEPEYRMLEAGEMIERGDEYSNCEGEWNPVLLALIGDPLADFSVGHYRRRTTPIQPLLDNPHLGR